VRRRGGLFLCAFASNLFLRVGAPDEAHLDEMMVECKRLVDVVALHDCIGRTIRESPDPAFP
jgi:hypothetical protein